MSGPEIVHVLTVLPNGVNPLDHVVVGVFRHLDDAVRAAGAAMLKMGEPALDWRGPEGALWAELPGEAGQFHIDALRVVA